MRFYKLKLSSIAFMTVIATYSPVSTAQDQNSTASNNVFMEELVVTARKKTESLQDVPLSIQAFSGDFLTAKGYDNISEIGNSVSNLEFDSLSPINGSSNTPNINIRGIGTTDFLLTIDPSVGIYVDGAYVARSVGGLLDLLDLEQVEVLKGPQGTLFGRNTIAGAILLTSKTPSDEFNFSAEAITGTDSRADLRMSISGPISENVAASFAVSSKNQDGYGRRLNYFDSNTDGLTPGQVAAITAFDERSGALLSGNTTGLAPGSLIAGGEIITFPPSGEEPGNTNTDSARFALAFDISDSTTANFAVDYSSTKETAPALVLMDIFYTDPSQGGGPNIAGLHSIFGFDAATVPFDERFIIDDNYSTFATGPGYNESETFGVSLNIESEISDNLSFKSITAYRDLDSIFGQDPDHSPFVLDAHTNDYVHEQFSQEFQLIGTSEKIDWVAGVYYFQEEGLDRVIVPLLHGLAALDQSNEIDNSAAAVFGQFDYSFNDQTTLTVGGRYSTEDKEYNQIHLDCGVANALGVAPGFVVNGCNSLSTGSAEEDFDNFSFNLAVSHRFNDDFMGYASYSTGFKSGGFTGRTVAFIPDQKPIPFEEENADTLEIGFKSDLLDNRVRLNGALFSTNYEDLQVTVQSGVAPITDNAGEVTINGAEFDIRAAITDTLNLTASIGLLDASYDERPASVGENLTNAPDESLGLSISYDIPLSGGSTIRLSGDYTYKSTIYNNSENTPLLTQDSISLLDAAITWVSADEHWTATLGGKNITDEEYLITGFFQPGVGYTEGVFARPSEWYLSVKYDF